MAHKTHEEIHKEIEEAKMVVNAGGLYSHFKNSESRYIVKGFALAEANDELCVLYANINDEVIVFIRPLVSWLEKVEHDGEMVDRFQPVSQ